MEPTAILSVAGLAYTLLIGPSYAYKPQKLEGTKQCEFAVIKVLEKTPTKIYVKVRDTAFVMHSQPTNKGVTNVRRYETASGKLVYLQLPEKAMILDNEKMQPLLNECKDIQG